MSKLDLNHVAVVLTEQVQRTTAHQVADPYRADPHRADWGALVPPAWGVADPTGTASLVAGCGHLYLAQAALGLPSDARLLEQAVAGIEYVLRAQHDSGLLDLLSCNYDSSPDTAFAVQRLAPLIELGRPLAAGDERWADVLRRVEAFIRRAVPGMVSGGFHTPNHRWVIAAALAQAAALFPDLDVRPTVDAYLAEGFDVDDEGAFIERSVGVYDAVCDRSLLLLYELLGIESSLDAVCANLRFDLTLLHSDGTAETGLSRRQDYGTEPVPLGLAAPFLYAGHLSGDAVFFDAACFLWDKAAAPGLDDLDWLCYVLLKHGEPPEPTTTRLADGAWLWPHNGIWRLRRGNLSVTVFRDTTRLATVRYGKAVLHALKISQSYFGVGRFVGDALTADGDGVILRSEGRSHPRRPGYDLPVGFAAPPERWAQVGIERDYRPLPPCLSELGVQPTEEGLSLRYHTLDGWPEVTAQMALDFAPGGVWETDDTCFQPQAGQVIFLKEGFGTMRYDHDEIRIGPGSNAHRIWQMRDAELAPHHVRVLLPLWTPVDHTVQVICASGKIGLK